MYDFSKYKFRCSSLGHLMTEPKLKADKDAGNLSESAKTHCMDIFIRQQYGRQDDIENRFVEKGLAVEEDSITLYSRVSKTFFKKNDKRLFNDFIQGEPDIFTGDTIETATSVKDIKSSWDIFTFYRTFGKKLNPLYEWQTKGYAFLTGAKNVSVAYCLVDTPEPLIEAEKRRMWYKLGQPNEDNELFQDACRVIERSMKYDDIPMNERILEYPVPVDPSEFELIKNKVIKAREYLVKLQNDLITNRKLCIQTNEIPVDV